MVPVKTQARATCLSMVFPQSVSPQTDNQATITYADHFGGHATQEYAK